MGTTESTHLSVWRISIWRIRERLPCKLEILSLTTSVAGFDRMLLIFRTFCRDASRHFALSDVLLPPCAKAASVP